jgi:hypothetical protein
MAGIVSSLFGPTPQELEAQRKEQQRELIKAYAAQGPRAAAGAGVGTLIGQGLTALFGNQDPEIQKATNVYKVLQEAQTELGSDVSDPTKLYPTLQKKFTEAGFPDVAAKVAEEGTAKIIDWNKSLKTKAELDNENNFRAEILAAQTDLGRPLTGDEMRNIGIKYAKPQELIASADKEAYRNLQVEMQGLRNEMKINEAISKGMKEKELLDYKFKLEKELKKYEADLKEGITNSKTSPQIDRLIGAATQATEDLKNVTAFGDRLATTRSYAGFKTGGGGWLNATKDALSQNLIDTDSQQMEVLYKGFSRAAAVVDAQGAATGLVGLQKSLESLAPGPNDSIQTVYTKLAQSKQIIDKGITAVLAKGKDIKPEQKQLLDDLKKDLNTAVPFSVSDVIKLGGSKTGVTLGDIVGKPSGIQEKVINGVTYINDGKGWRVK